jgi:hypothetical protein
MAPRTKNRKGARRKDSKVLLARRRRALVRRAGVGAVAAVLVAGLAFAVLSAGPTDTSGMPAFARRSPDIEAAYTFAASKDGAALQWMACYCGCGSGPGHTDVRACFVSPDGSGFDDHGSRCGICVDIVLRVQSGLAEGKDLLEIRNSIDAAYVGYTPTDTPMPP